MKTLTDIYSLKLCVISHRINLFFTAFLHSAYLLKSNNNRHIFSWRYQQNVNFKAYNNNIKSIGELFKVQSNVLFMSVFCFEREPLECRRMHIWALKLTAKSSLHRQLSASEAGPHSLTNSWIRTWVPRLYNKEYWRGSWEGMLWQRRNKVSAEISENHILPSTGREFHTRPKIRQDTLKGLNMSYPS